MPDPLIIIDAGHGGQDEGGGSNQYWKEKDFTLKISQYQYQRFQQLGIEVAMTRMEDVTLSPRERTERVKQSGADYCISNHINSGGGEGAEVIHSIYDHNRLPHMIMDEIVRAGQKNRRVFSRRLDEKTDYYFMHRETGRVVTYIIEYGFADNKRDVERLRANWIDYAEAVVKAFCEYLNLPYQPPKEDNQNDFPAGTPLWKKELIDWLYEKQLLDDPNWKARVNEPIPLWALAAILQDVYRWFEQENGKSNSK